MTTSHDEYPVLPFATASAFEQWIAKHHDQPGIWIKLAKKASGIPSITYAEALDIALCYGWIDGLKRGLDDSYFLQKFTPRRPKGTWSKRNVAKIAQLTAAGRMQPAGLAEVNNAKRDGRWDAAYDSPKDMVMPEDFLLALSQNAQAKATFDGLNRTNTYAIAFQLATAKKPETRERRIHKFVAMLERGERLY